MKRFLGSLFGGSDAKLGSESKQAVPKLKPVPKKEVKVDPKSEEHFKFLQNAEAADEELVTRLLTEAAKRTHGASSGSSAPSIFCDWKGAAISAPDEKFATEHLVEAKTSPAAAAVIFDTDIGSDVDDALALLMLLHLPVQVMLHSAAHR